jgi:hypothetical protein
MSTAALWYYHKEGRGFGPMQETDIGRLLARNEIAANTLVWRDGLSNWTEAQSTELGGFLSRVRAPPASPVAPASRRKHSKLYWRLFTLAELFNLFIFGVPLFAALILWR